jgi:hypothetical protein
MKKGLGSGFLFHFAGPGNYRRAVLAETTGKSQHFPFLKRSDANTRAAELCPGVETYFSNVQVCACTKTTVSLTIQL